MPPKAPSWQRAGELFPACNLAELDILPQVLSCVRPLTDKHLKSLPRDIRDLSALLTYERGSLNTPYWSKPNYLTAYLYYFLPWNLVRLIRLFKGLDLPPPPLDQPLLLDAGSGPLTVPLALWLAKPEWRDSPIEVVALDSARQPMQVGMRLWSTLAQKLNCSHWTVRTIPGPLAALPKYARHEPWLITAANVLNELKNPVPQHGAENPGILENLLCAWQPLWTDGHTRLLFIEPGTRLGGKTIMNLRAAALQYDLFPHAPCTHAYPCPLLENKHPDSWCHFVFSAQGAPEWLKELSRKAGLFKTSLSLSPLLLAAHPAPTAAQKPTRVISQPFPAQGGICRYGCSGKGLGLLKNAKNVFSGTLTFANPTCARDKKSGAVILEPKA